MRGIIMNMDRLIFHIDVNSAFISWEAARRVSEGKPDIRLVPSVVARKPEIRGSIVAAKSIPAKMLGITTGEPTAMACRKCPGLIIAEPDMELYMECSQQFMEICRNYSTKLEKYSIDECFIDLTKTKYYNDDYMKTAIELKDRIKKELGFTVNVGVGPNKLLAKMAGDLKKPDMVHLLDYDNMKAVMWRLPVSELLFCGKASVDKLKNVGIKTIGELAQLDEAVAMQILGAKTGKMLYDYANGIDASPVITTEREAKSYSMAHTLEENITELDKATGVIDELATALAYKLRKDKVRAGCIGVNIRSADFKDWSHQMKLDTATDITAEIVQCCNRLLAQVWKNELPVRQLGVTLSNVTKENYEQLSLFDIDNVAREKNRKMDSLMDEMKEKYGNGVLVKGFPE